MYEISISFPFVANIPSYKYVCVCVYTHVHTHRILFIPVSFDAHLGYFYFGAIMNKE